jgi:hypothetical protein
LSGERFMTQFEMMMSTLASATGRCSISPKRNSTFEYASDLAYPQTLQVFHKTLWDSHASYSIPDLSI